MGNRRSEASLLIGLGLFALWLAWPLVDPARSLIWRDIPQMVVPNLAFQGEALREGFAPFVQLRRGPGMPFLGDPQTGAWYPGTWLAALAGPDTGFRVHQWAHLVWLGLGFALLGQRRRGNSFAGLLAGMIAMAATPHLHGLEWTHITAGVAWVPWSLLAAVSGHPRLWGGCLALMIASGHAYLWVMAPVVALAGMILLPRDLRGRGVRCLLALPLLTLPVWLGYLQLAGQFEAHGFTDRQAAPITGFDPGHLLGFLMPRALRDFRFVGSDGGIKTVRQWGAFGWSRQCYVGILALVLGIWGLWHRGKWRQAALCLTGGGLLLSMGLSWVAGRWPWIGRHIHHPASFIQLTSWGLLILAASGFQVISRSRRPISRERAVLHVLLPIGLGAVHHQVAEAALYGGLSPLWNFSWRVGWVAWPLASLALLGGHAWTWAGPPRASRPGLLISPRWVTMATLGRLVFLPLLFLSLVIGDAAWHSQPCLPRSLPPSSLPAGLFEGRPAGRLAVDPGLEAQVLRPPEWGSLEEMAAAYGFLARSGLPVIEVPNGFGYLGDYNPPFAHPGRRFLVGWLFGEDRPPEEGVLPLSFEDVRARAARLGVRYLVTHRHLAGPIHPLTTHLRLPEPAPLASMAFQGTWRVNLYDLGEPPPCTIMSRRDFLAFQEGALLATPSSREVSPIDVEVGPRGLRVRVPVSLGPGLGVCWPILPLPGWEALQGEEPAPELGRRFGIWIPMEDRREAGLVYSPPGLAWWLAGALAGGLLLWRLGRPSWRG